VLSPQRVVGWSGFTQLFGGLVADQDTPYAARGYFDNGGDAAHVVRVAGPESLAAHGELVLGTLDTQRRWAPGAPALAAFPSARFAVVATSPGEWATGTQVELRYRAAGSGGRPEVDVRVKVPGEPVERFTRVDPATLPEAVARSRFVRLWPLGDEPLEPATTAGPRSATWRVTLGGGHDDPPRPSDYLAAVRFMQDVAEPALIAAPDLHDDLRTDDAAIVLDMLLDTSADARDRLVLVDVPEAAAATLSAVAWLDALRERTEPSRHRSAAAYHPRLVVRDPLGGTSRPLRPVPASGHVAGVISRLDRERGAGHSPANAALYEAVDVASALPGPAQAALTATGGNVLRCAAGGGLEVWGARTLDLLPEGRFVAHRRLLHLLVRAIRRVAEPLVFEGNDAELRLTFTRSITSVLFQAWNAGALKGERPEQGFRVQCDDANNPPEERDLGRVVCDVEVAPAAPMEFIHIRLALTAGGLLEVVES
jgi:hypothetical protein